MNIRDNLIKLLGGFTSREYHKILTDEGNELTQQIIPIYAESKTYCIDNDGLIYDKTQIARHIGERMLENNLIDFTIKQKQDKLGAKIYCIRGKAFVNELKH